VNQIDFMLNPCKDSNYTGTDIKEGDITYVTDEVMEKLKQDALRRRAERNDVRMIPMKGFEFSSRRSDKKRDKNRAKYIRRKG